MITFAVRGIKYKKKSQIEINFILLSNNKKTFSAHYEIEHDQEFDF